MAKYLVESTLTTEGTKGLLAEGGTKRKQVIEKAIGDMGGKLEALYYAFGDRDMIVIVDMPDSVSGAAINLQIAAAGIARNKTTELLTPQEIDKAARKTTSYRPPGG